MAGKGKKKAKKKPVASASAAAAAPATTTEKDIWKDEEAAAATAPTAASEPSEKTNSPSSDTETTSAPQRDDAAVSADEGAAVLADALKGNTSVSSIDLSNKKVDDEGATALRAHTASESSMPSPSDATVSTADNKSEKSASDNKGEKSASDQKSEKSGDIDATGADASSSPSETITSSNEVEECAASDNSAAAAADVPSPLPDTDNNPDVDDSESSLQDALKTYNDAHDSRDGNDGDTRRDDDKMPSSRDQMSSMAMMPADMLARRGDDDRDKRHDDPLMSFHRGRSDDDDDDDYNDGGTRRDGNIMYSSRGQSTFYDDDDDGTRREDDGMLGQRMVARGGEDDNQDLWGLGEIVSHVSEQSMLDRGGDDSDDTRQDKEFLSAINRDKRARGGDDADYTRRGEDYFANFRRQNMRARGDDDTGGMRRGDDFRGQGMLGRGDDDEDDDDDARRDKGFVSNYIREKDMREQDMRARRGANNNDSRRADNFRGQVMRARGDDDDDDMRGFRGQGTLAGMFNDGDDTRRGGNFMSTVRGQNMLTRRDDDYDNVEAELRQSHSHLYNNADSNVRPHRPPSSRAFNDERQRQSSPQMVMRVDLRPPRYNGELPPLKGQLRTSIVALVDGRSALIKERQRLFSVYEPLVDACKAKSSELDAILESTKREDNKSAAMKEKMGKLGPLFAEQYELRENHDKTAKLLMANEASFDSHHFQIGQLCVELLTALQINKRLPAGCGASNDFHPLCAEVEEAVNVALQLDVTFPKMMTLLQKYYSEYGFDEWRSEQFNDIFSGQYVEISADEMLYARLRRRYYVRMLMEMIIEDTVDDAKSPQFADRQHHVIAYHAYMWLERTCYAQLRDKIGVTETVKRAETNKAIFDYCDAVDVEVAAAKLTFPGMIGGEQAVISVYEWHAEATHPDADVTTQLKQQIVGMADEMVKKARLRRIKEKTEERCRKKMMALNNGLPVERKQLQALFMQQVEDDSGGVGALLRLVHDKVGAASKASSDGGGKLKAKASKQSKQDKQKEARERAINKGKYKSRSNDGKFSSDDHWMKKSFFDKGDDGVKDAHKHGLIDVNAVTKTGMTSLMLAALGGDVIAVKHLLAAGADVMKASRTKPHTTIDFLKSRNAAKYLMRDGKVVIDGAGVAALKKDALFGEGEVQLILMLASATVVAVTKADALKAKQVEAEALMQGDWLDDVDDGKSAKGGGGGGGGGGDGGGKKKKMPKKKGKQQKKSAVDTSTPSASDLAASAAKETAAAALFEAEQVRREDTELQSSTDKRDAAAKQLEELYAKLCAADAIFASETRDATPAQLDAAVAAVTPRVEKNIADMQRAADNATDAANDEKARAVEAAASMRADFEAAFADVGAEGRNDDGRVTIAGATAFEAKQDALLEERRVDFEIEQMAYARGIAGFNGEMYTSGCADDTQIATQADDDATFDLDLGSLSTSEICILMAAQCGNLAAYAETQPWNESAGR
jgi:hypothetical protein